MGFCQMIENTAVGSAVGYNGTILSIIIATVSLLAIIYIFMSLLRSVKEEHFRLYLIFSLLSAFTFVLALAQRLLPLPVPGSASEDARSYGVFLKIFLAVLISSQWFIQTAAVFFLLLRNPAEKSMLRWRVILPAVLMMFGLLVPWVVTTIMDKEQIGEIFGESILVLFFLAAILLSSMSFRRCLGIPDFFMHPRPMMSFWAGFMLLAHIGFLITYTIRGALPGSESASCSYVFVDTLYYILYAPLLMYVIRRDSRYWSEHGSLLLDMQLAMEEQGPGDTWGDNNRDGVSEVAGIPLIPFSQLVFREKIGSGGYSEVFRALWNDSNVAVKVFRVAQGQLVTMNELLKEARIMYKLDHPNVLKLLGLAMRGRRVKASAKKKRVEEQVMLEQEPLLMNGNSEYDSSRIVVDDQLVDLSSHDVILCTVSVFCSRGSLWSRIHAREEEFPILLRRRLLVDVARGMAYLHAQNVIHRDLKSPNVLITDGNAGMIADFGLSRDVFGSNAATMTAIGTPHWMSPELLRGERYSSSADVWAFGVIVHEVATRKQPYQGIAPIVIMHRVAHESLKLELPKTDPLHRITEACFREAAERPSFDEILQMLGND